MKKFKDTKDKEIKDYNDNKTKITSTGTKKDANHTLLTNDSDSATQINLGNNSDNEKQTEEKK